MVIPALRKTATDIKEALGSIAARQRIIDFYYRMPVVGKTRAAMKADICSAINSRQCIEFYYHGGFRIVEPFCFGVIMHRDREALLCYQVSGHVEFGEPVGWKLYRFSEMSRLAVIDSCFAVRPDYNPDRIRMSLIYCRVSPTPQKEAAPETLTVSPPTPQPPVKPSENEDITLSSPDHYVEMKQFRSSHSGPPSHPSEDQD
jgi:hypothetical protein